MFHYILVQNALGDTIYYAVFCHCLGCSLIHNSTFEIRNKTNIRKNFFHSSVTFTASVVRMNRKTLKLPTIMETLLS